MTSEQKHFHSLQVREKDGIPDTESESGESEANHSLSWPLEYENVAKAVMWKRQEIRERTLKAAQNFSSGHTTPSQYSSSTNTFGDEKETNDERNNIGHERTTLNDDLDDPLENNNSLCTTRVCQEICIFALACVAIWYIITTDVVKLIESQN
jgi:hypothetical protein